MTFEAIHCFDRATVRFAIHPKSGAPRILGEITEDALRAIFHARGGVEELLLACELNFGTIEAKALEHYATFPTSPIYLAAADFFS